MFLRAHVIGMRTLPGPLLRALTSVRVACTSERRRIDSRHPDARFVDLEQVGDKVIEVDVLFSVIEEGQFAVVAVTISCAQS